MKPAEKAKRWAYIEATTDQSFDFTERRLLEDMLRNKTLLRAIGFVFSEVSTYGDQALALNPTDGDLSTQLAILSGKKQGMSRLIDGLLDLTEEKETNGPVEPE